VVNVQGQPIKISSTHMGAKVLGWTQSTLVRARSKGTRINPESGDCEREHTQNSCRSLRARLWRRACRGAPGAAVAADDPMRPISRATEGIAPVKARIPPDPGRRPLTNAGIRRSIGTAQAARAPAVVTDLKRIVSKLPATGYGILRGIRDAGDIGASRPTWGITAGAAPDRRARPARACPI
jgi:hypothetical protein